MQVFFVVLVSLDFFQPPLTDDTDIADNNNERRIYVFTFIDLSFGVKCERQFSNARETRWESKLSN